MELMRNASKEVYLEIEILSIPALCTPFRLDPATIPPGMCPRIFSAQSSPRPPIDLRPGDQQDLSAEDFIVQGGTEVYTAAQFQDKYLPPPPTRTQAHARARLHRWAESAQLTMFIE